MSDKHKQFAEELLSVRPVTRDLVTSILIDAWPSHTAVVDFGIDSNEHYEALYYPIREAEIMPKDLDAALGNGPKLTAMTRAAPGNPHKDVEFQTSWDMVFGRDAGGGTTREADDAFNEGRQEKLPGVGSVEEQLLAEIRQLAGREFVYEDGWCGMVPFDGSLSELQTGPPVPFAELNWREQADVLREFIHWDHYPARDWDDEYTIRESIAAGKQSEQWLEGTSLQEAVRLLAEGKTPPPPKQCPEITEQDLRAALAEAAPQASAPPVKASYAPESAGAKAFRDIFRNDSPRETRAKTQEWSGWEV